MLHRQTDGWTGVSFATPTPTGMLTPLVVSHKEEVVFADPAPGISPLTREEVAAYVELVLPKLLSFRLLVHNKGYNPLYVDYYINHLTPLVCTVLLHTKTGRLEHLEYVYPNTTTFGIVNFLADRHGEDYFKREDLALCAFADMFYAERDGFVSSYPEVRELQGGWAKGSGDKGEPAAKVEVKTGANACAHKKNNPFVEEVDQCAVCLDTYQPTSVITKLNSCGHYAHKGCYDLWMQQQMAGDWLIDVRCVQCNRSAKVSWVVNEILDPECRATMY